MDLLKDLESGKASNNSKNKNTISSVESKMFVKEDAYYNDKVEMQSSISTLYNSFDEFKESLSGV